MARRDTRLWRPSPARAAAGGAARGPAQPIARSQAGSHARPTQLAAADWRRASSTASTVVAEIPRGLVITRVGGRDLQRPLQSQRQERPRLQLGYTYIGLRLL